MSDSTSTFVAESGWRLEIDRPEQSVMVLDLHGEGDPMKEVRLRGRWSATVYAPDGREVPFTQADAEVCERDGVDAALAQIAARMAS